MEITGLIASTMILGIALFQLLIALGFPLSKAAWGGQHKVIPNKLRLTSGVFVFVYIIAILMVLSKSGVISIINDSTSNIFVWILVVFFGFGVFMNAISRSKLERLWSPYLFVLTLLCLSLLL